MASTGYTGYRGYRGRPYHPPQRTARKRHPWLRRIFIYAALFGLWWFNNYALRTDHTSLRSDKIKEPFRAVIIADQHASENSISNDKILSRIDNAEPDIIFVLGDMYSRDSTWEEIKKPIGLMSDLTAKGYPVYFVTGDHDKGGDYLLALKSARIRIMDYRTDVVDIKGNSLQIMGINSVSYSDNFDLSTAFTRDPASFSILLAHIPNYRAFSSFGADLTLCADTHGGMTRLPFLGPVLDTEDMTLFPKLKDGKEIYDKGWFDYEGGSMFITSGIGASPLPIRFWNRPEVVVMDIEPL